MNETVNLHSMTADSTAALERLARDVKDLKRLLEVRALKDNYREVVVNPKDLPHMEFQSK